MKAIELNMPDETYKKLENLASQDRQSVNAYALRKLEEFAAAFEDFKQLEQRAKAANPEKFQETMSKVSSTPPILGDEV